VIRENFRQTMASHTSDQALDFVVLPTAAATNQSNQTLDKSLFAHWQRLTKKAESRYTGAQRNQGVLAAQRHAKVLGIFVRLYKRDGKANYLEHLPRVLALYTSALKREAALEPVLQWMVQNLPFEDINLNKL
jgi:aminoglycoside/choline kinase family phosphotransferase